MKKNKKGFTLIELLVVIAIIGLLSTLAIVALNNARQQSRDAKRVADIKQIQTALELYYNDNFSYPADVSSGDAIATTTPSDITYMGQVPHAPTPPDGTCDETSNTYTYATTDNDSTYTLDYCIGAATGNVPVGENTATPAGIHDN